MLVYGLICYVFVRDWVGFDWFLLGFAEFLKKFKCCWFEYFSDAFLDIFWNFVTKKRWYWIYARMLWRHLWFLKINMQNSVFFEYTCEIPCFWIHMQNFILKFCSVWIYSRTSRICASHLYESCKNFWFTRKIFDPWFLKSLKTDFSLMRVL
jgi:hypothetical protein